MRWYFFVMFLILASTRIANAQTQPRQHSWLGFLTSAAKVCPGGPCCPDDYCRKPMPHLCPLPRCGAPDDYCAKPYPCLTPVPRGCICDDYCPKPLPYLLCPPLTPYLQCAPACVHANDASLKRR